MAENRQAGAGLGLFCAGLRDAGVRPGPLAVASATAWALIGLIGCSLVWANLAFLAFWVESAEPVDDVALQLRTAGQYPVVYYPNWARLGLTTIVPAPLVAAFPVQQLVEVSGQLPVAVLGVVAGLALTNLHWSLGLRRYSSAGS